MAHHQPKTPEQQFKISESSFKCANLKQQSTYLKATGDHYQDTTGLVRWLSVESRNLMLYLMERKALFVTGVTEISKYARQQRMYIVSCQSTYHQLLSDSGSTLKGLVFEGEHRLLALQTSQSCQHYVLALPI